MTFLFEAILKNGGICCTITAEQTVENSVFCFSLMAPGSVAAGGHLIRRVGGFHEVQLPALAAGHPHVIELTYDDPNIGVKNRAWLPLGSYLRVGDACHSLPSLELGVRAGPEQSIDAYEGLPLVPAPTHWKPALGTVRAEGFWFSDDQLDKVNALAMRTSAKLFKNQAGLAVIVQRQADMPQEGYELSITPGKVIITAAAHSGIFYAGITLLNLFITTNGLLPCGRIEDQPRFPWRGQHLDCARHFFKTDTITGLLDLMALLKLNRFHWHFSDDEAFRIEIPNLPEVWQKSRCRGEGAYMPGVFGGGMKACGSYSVSDVERIVAHAKALHIEVLPEIEIPAHSYVLN
ncbi:MAG: family 20 glycosylhydrolase, partial [Paracoccaceae bacterium]